MLALLAAMLLIDPSATPAPVPASPSPLRTVVYKVSISQRYESHFERYNSIETRNTTYTDDGRVTIDVMVKADTLLGVRVIEDMRSRGYSATFTGNVGPDGSVHFAADSINDVSITLLRYFGVRFAADQTLAAGTTWNPTDATQFKVKSVDGRHVTLEITEHLKVAHGSSTVLVTGEVLYDSGLLVPMRGDITQHRTELHPEGAVDLYRTLHFERQSDTFDTTATL